MVTKLRYIIRNFFALALLFVQFSGCSHSLPPYPPPLDDHRSYRDATPNVEDNELAISIANIRNAKGGLYVDLLICGPGAALRARLLTDQAQRENDQVALIHIKDTNSKPLLVCKPDTDAKDYTRARSPIFGSPPYIGPGEVVAQTYELSGTNCVVQTWVVRVCAEIIPGQYTAMLVSGWTILPDRQWIKRPWYELGGQIRVRIAEQPYKFSIAE